MEPNAEKGRGCFSPDADGEFGIYTDLADFPLGECPSYLNYGIGAVCLSGTASIQVFNNKCPVRANTVISLIPWQLASLKDVSEDFRLTFFRVSLDMFTDSLSTLCRFTPEFFFYLSEYFTSQPDKGHIGRFLYFCDLLACRAEQAPRSCRRESIMQLLRVFYWDVYAYYVNSPQARKTIRYTRKEELSFRFMRLIIEHHAPHKDVAYYAQRLGITPKYLTNLIRSMSGKSAREWIVYYTILEIKALLRESSMDLKTIASRVNFPDQTTLSRFFRHYTGVTPSEYRENIHF